MSSFKHEGVDALAHLVDVAIMANVHFWTGGCLAILMDRWIFGPPPDLARPEDQEWILMQVVLQVSLLAVVVSCTEAMMQHTISPWWRLRDPRRHKGGLQPGFMLFIGFAWMSPNLLRKVSWLTA